MRSKMYDQRPFPKGTDPEIIIDWGDGAPTDHIREIKNRAESEDILRSFFIKNNMKGYMTVFFGSNWGMVTFDSNSMEPSDSGRWDEDGEFLEVSYINGKVKHIFPDGTEEDPDGFPSEPEDEEE
ncbi:MAG: hypothetical protein WBQ36_01310 [Desulfobaccales bacterium]